MTSSNSNPYIVPRPLIDKYNTRGPRYTSYPTAPEWKTPFSSEDGLEAFRLNSLERPNVPLSLYLHIPFCVKLCYYCGCNRIITRNDELVRHYLEAIDKEVAMVAAQVGKGRKVVQIHWGGGTPTHLSPDQIRQAFRSLSSRFELDRDAEISIEVHPTVTSQDHLEALRECGFNRISMGIQDFDPEVQKAVNRLQTFELTETLIRNARALGFISVNVDLMYGLPLQTVPKFTETLRLVEVLAPDRVALFNYAHVPHLQKGQAMIDPEAIPAPEVKLELFERAIDHFVGHDYRYIGMDHFARPDDELTRAQDNRSLRRNFMGYTTCADSDLIAFGMSSITDLDTVYMQNIKGLENYFAAVDNGKAPVNRGIRLTADDRLRRDVINRLICHCRLEKSELEAQHGINFNETFAVELKELEALAEDGLVKLSEERIEVTPRGQVLLRNICMPFDAYLRRMAPEQRMFSRTV